MQTVVFVSGILLAAGARVPVDLAPDAQSFMHAKTEAVANATSGAVPALQPADVFDSDFPVDMAGKTPQELRYQAQADYARAIAALKREAAEAEAARIEMEKQLKELEAAKKAAADAKAAAEAAAAEQAKLKAQLAKEKGEATQAGADAANAQGAVSKEQAELDAANKAYADAAAAEDAAAAKIAAMKKKHAELCAQIKELEAEQAAASGGAQKANSAVGNAQQGITKSEGELSAAEAAAAQEDKEAAAASAEAEAAKAKLAKAEALTGKSGKDHQAAVAAAKKDYEMAKEKYIKEANDVKAVEKRVAMAKAELAKWETRSSAKITVPAVMALVLGCFLTL